ncbi:MAG: energy transducer TonB [Tannerella sp.]|jgi:TonB family protein|nr:energy transducer TonB [Tannerella sp.]
MKNLLIVNVKKIMLTAMIVWGLTVSSACNSGNGKANATAEVKESVASDLTLSEMNESTVAGDTTVYDAPAGTPELLNAIEYFRQNNQFKDWDKKNAKNVILQGIVEMDSTITRVKILRPSNVKELDDEALRLIQSGKYAPGKNEQGKDVRSKITISVNFPAL